jgi:hypothetical protein
MDKRINQRKPYSGDIFFVAKNGFNEGRLKNFSRSGLFIYSKAKFCGGPRRDLELNYSKTAEM